MERGKFKARADRANSPNIPEPQVQKGMKHVKILDFRQKYMAISADE